MKHNSFNPGINQEFLDLLKVLIEKYSRPASEIILDDVDVRNLLKISRRTSLEYRKKKIFPSYRVDDGTVTKDTSKGKIYYILSEVIEGIKTKGGNHGK